MADSKISALTNYTPPLDSDILPIVDVANSTTKKVTWANIKATLKTYFDTLYQATLVSGTNIKTINSNSILGSGDLSISATVSDGDKGDITVSSSGTVWNIDAATVGITELSASGTPSGSTFLRGDNTWATPAGSGDVSKVGTPVNNQVGVWTGDGTIEGDSALTFDTTTDTLTVGAIVATPEVRSTSSAGTNIANSSGTVVADFGTGGSTNASIHGSINIGVDSADYVQFVGGTGSATENIIGLSTNIDKVIVPKGTGRFQVTGGAYVTGTLDLGNTSDTTISRSSAGIIAVEGVTVPLNSTTSIHTAQQIELGHASDTTITRTGAGAIAVEGVGVALNSTSLAHTASQYEVGNASDTTITRSSAGVIAVEGVVVPTISSTNTLTNKRMQTRTASSTSASTLTPDLSSANVYFRTTQTVTLTINAPTGTPAAGEVITIYVDSAGAQTLTIDSTYKAFGAAFPSTTTAGKTFMMTAMYNGTDWKTTWSNAI